MQATYDRIIREEPMTEEDRLVEKEMAQLLIDMETWPRRKPPETEAEIMFERAMALLDIEYFASSDPLYRRQYREDVDRRLSLSSKNNSK